ncbi:MAG: ABC transporter permease [Anaerolineales bacterium]
MTELSNRASLSTGDRLRESLFYFPLVFGAIILIALLLVVLFGPLWAPHNPYLIDRIVLPHYDFDTEEFIRVPLAPSTEFPLGTDERGMDILSLLLYGARNTMIVGMLVAAGRVVFGLLAGMLMGWNENRSVDRVLSGLIGILTSVPALIAAMILVYSFGIRGGMLPFVAALIVMGWTEVAQFMRGEVMVLRKMPFMEGARVVGARDSEMLLRHVFPNILPQLFVISFLEIGSVLMLMGELALLGVFIGGGSTLDFSDIMAPPLIVGIPSQPEWAAMVASGFRWLRSEPYVVMMPAAAIFMAVLGFNSFGEGLRAFFEKRGVKATFLLGRRILWIFLGASLLIAVVLNSTRPSRWYKEMAAGYQGERTITDARALLALSGRAVAQDDILPAAQMIANEFDENGLKGGIPFATYVYARSGEYIDSSQPPVLEILDAAGGVVHHFESAKDIAYVVDTAGSGGDVSGPLSLVLFPDEFTEEVSEAIEALDVSGRVVLLQEGNARSWLGAYFASRGASAVIWAANQGAALNDSPLRIPDLAEEIAVPTLRVSADLAAQLLADSQIDLSEMPSNLLTRELDKRVRISVNLQPAKPLELNSVVAYRPGTDADLGNEIVLLFAACDGLWSSQENIPVSPSRATCAAPMMMEISRLLNENLIDTRRPVMFVVCGGRRIR